MEEATDAFGLIGQRIDGKYRVESVVGEGGFGVVYRATHEGFDAPVAIKCLKVPPSFDKKAQDALVAQLREEGRLLLKLSQRTAGIVQARDIGTHVTSEGARVPFLVLEWLEGSTLADDLRARRRADRPARTLKEAVALLDPAAKALAIAHEQRIAHRDIKPENLMLVAAGDTSTLKVLDFGIAKVLEEASSAIDAKTSRAAPMLTPGYAAPEQYEKARGATGPWSDVFSLALVFIEVVAGKRAIAGNELMEAYKLTVDADRRPSLQASGVAVPKEVERVLAKALEVEPRSRWQHAGELWTALTRAVEDAPALAPAKTSSDDASISTAEFVQSAGLSSVETSPRARSMEPPEDLGKAATVRATTRGPVVSSTAPAEPKRVPKVALAAGVVALAGGAAWLLTRGPDSSTLPPSASAAGSVPTSSAAGSASDAPVSTNAEATALFNEAVHAWRGGDPDGAVSRMLEAVEKDRALAAGSLRLAAWRYTKRAAQSRDHYDDARRHEAALPAKDKLLLAAVGSLVAVPEDLPGYLAKLEDATKAYPDDAELWALIAQGRIRRLNYTEAARAAEQALAIDGAHVAAWVFLGDAKAGLGDVEGRVDAYRKCVGAAPRALECHHKLVGARSSLGQCKEMLEEARVFTTAAPRSARAQRYLAISLHANAAAPEAVAEALDKGWSLLPQKERSATEPRDRSAVAVLAGDFEGALAALEPWRQSVAKETDQQSHLELELVALDIQREMGKAKEARARAEGLRRKMVAWSEPNVGDWTLTLDRYRLFDGGMTAEEFARERDAWAERVRAKWARAGRKGDGELEWTLWVTGYGALALDEASAKRALETMPKEVAALSTGRYTTIDATIAGSTCSPARRRKRARPSSESRPTAPTT